MISEVVQEATISKVLALVIVPAVVAGAIARICAARYMKATRELFQSHEIRRGDKPKKFQHLIYLFILLIIYEIVRVLNAGHVDFVVLTTSVIDIFTLVLSAQIMLYRRAEPEPPASIVWLTDRLASLLVPIEVLCLTLFLMFALKMDPPRFFGCLGFMAALYNLHLVVTEVDRVSLSEIKKNIDDLVNAISELP